MPKPEITRCKVDVTASGETYSVHSATIDLRVGELPIARLSGVADDSTVSRPEVTKPMTSESRAAMSKRQQARLKGRTAPDVTIEADDGFGRTLSFSGYLAAPLTEVSKSSFVDSISVLGDDSAIDGLDLSIYGKGSEKLREESDQGQLASAYKYAEEGNPPAMLKEITSVLMGEYQADLSNTENDSMKALLTQQHNLNEGTPIEIWKGILDASDVVFESWAKVGKEYKETVTRGIVVNAGSMMQQQDSGFWNVIQRVSASFQMVYVPATKGRGRFIRVDDRVKGSPVDIDVSGLVVSMLDGSQRIMQPGGVVITAPAVNGVREVASGLGVAGQYPDTLLPGFIHRTPTPMWLCDEKGVPVFGHNTAPTPGGGMNLSLTDAKSRIEKTEKSKEDLTDYIGKVLKELCEVVYNDIRLADSTVSVTVPLSFAAEPGDRVALNFGNNVTVTGFLTSVSHRITLQGRQFSGTTSYVVTHVEY